MPARIVVQLGPAGLHPLGPPPQAGPGLQAAVLAALREVDPQLSQRVHDWPAPKPMALAGLLDLDTFEVGLLDDVLVAPVQAALHPGRGLRVGRSRYAVAAIRSSQRSWDELATAPMITPWRLRFVTPTTFHTNRDGSVRCNRPLPDPELLFGSLLRRWRTYSDVALADVTEELLGWGVTLDAYRLQTGPHLVNTRPHQTEIGFTGVVTVSPTRAPRLPDTAVHGIASLARLGVFAGVGAHTMQGMGCLRLSGPTR